MGPTLILAGLQALGNRQLLRRGLLLGQGYERKAHWLLSFMPMLPLSWSTVLDQLFAFSVSNLSPTGRQVIMAIISLSTVTNPLEKKPFSFLRSSEIENFH